MRFEIEVLLDKQTYLYHIALELPEGFQQYRVLSEALSVDGQPLYTRSLAQVTLSNNQFSMDWHKIALPNVYMGQPPNPLSQFKEWLGNMLILMPVPKLMQGDSDSLVAPPEETLLDIGKWCSWLLRRLPKTYTLVMDFVKQYLPDIEDIRNEQLGAETYTLIVVFSKAGRRVEILFNSPVTPKPPKSSP